MKIWLPIVVLAISACAAGQTHVYVAELEPTAVTLAWGTTEGKSENTIGRGAAGLGQVTVRLGERSVETSASSLRFDSLTPDSTYPYSVTINGKRIAEGKVRTWPERAEALTFFVIGDFGNGSKEQWALARRLEEERRRLEAAGEPVRFVLSTGDNIYGLTSGSGTADRDWESKFFGPYGETLAAIPFRAVIGNHDGNESEKAGDLGTYLDNYFQRERWYRFTFGGLVEFLALDSSSNQASGPPAPVYGPEGLQTKWLAEQLALPPLPWRIAVLHHPMFTAGPRHEPFSASAPHWLKLFEQGAVRAVFSGHEHNLQFSEQDAATGHMQFVVSGAGGELRHGNVEKKMKERHIAAWAAQRHFLVVRMDSRQMSVTPLGVEEVKPRNAQGLPVGMPLIVPRSKPKQ